MSSFVKPLSRSIVQKKNFMEAQYFCPAVVGYDFVGIVHEDYFIIITDEIQVKPIKNSTGR